MTYEATKKRTIIIWLAILLIVAAERTYDWYTNNTTGTFMVEGIPFATTSYRGVYPEEYDPDTEGVRNYGPVADKLVGVIEKEIKFPTMPTNNLEGFKIAPGTKIYTISKEAAAKEENDFPMSICGLLLESESGEWFYAYPWRKTGEDMKTVGDRVLNTFYGGSLY